MTQMDTVKFWSRVSSKGAAECWKWEGRTNGKGYGRYGNQMAHRVAYELAKGPIPKGLIVRHSCDNPGCCNPNHLDAGTHKDNTQDSLDRGRFALGNRHGNTKITDAAVIYIRRNPDELSVTTLALRYAVSKSTISLIQRGLRRKHAKATT